MKKLNKKAIFGLDSVHQFFLIILVIAILVYVIIVIFGTLSSNTSSILGGQGSKIDTLNNAYNTTSSFSVSGQQSVQCTVTSVTDSTTGLTISPSHYSINNCQITQIP